MVPSPHDLLAGADAALAAGDLAAVRALVAETARIDDPHPRYTTRRALVHLALNAAHADGPRPAERMLAAARVALDVLAPAPAEPVLLNVAGVTLYELGALRGAEALFRAVATLDPAYPYVARNLEEIARRRRENVSLRLPVQVTMALPELERRALDLVRDAKPSPPQTISLCMIVKDEEEMLPRTLAAAVPAVDEIVVVDTGSTDRTVEIAREFGARVIEHPWNDDFAEARNVGIDAATSEWILILDADEVLVAEDAARLREVTGRTWRDAFNLVVINYVGGGQDGTAVTTDGLRLFRNQPQLRYEGRIHEGIADKLPHDAPERTEQSGVRVEHYGYLHGTRQLKDKSRRNLELLLRQAEEIGPNAYHAYNLGSEYAAIGDHATAIEHFGASFRMLVESGDAGTAGFAPALVSRYVSALRLAGRLDEAEAIALEGLELFDGFTDLELERAQIARERGDVAACEALLRRCLEMGDAPSRFAASVGAGSFLAATMLGWLHLGRGDAARAEALLLDTLASHPGFVGALLPLAKAMLARGAGGEEIAGEVAERIGGLSPTTRFLLATALHEGGRPADAERQLRALLETDAGAHPARVALAESLLAQRLWADAADAASEVPRDSGWAPAAATSEAFGRLVAGDLDAARAAAARAADPHRPVLLAWADAAAGATTGRPLPAACLPVLADALEALLRVEEVDAFTTLLPLTERVEGLSSRARREVMACLYARRGFLESAADEWMAACHEGGPDAAALTGLARVAAARGATDDAVLFAEGALELDPGSAAAGQVLEAVGAR